MTLLFPLSVCHLKNIVCTVMRHDETAMVEQSCTFFEEYLSQMTWTVSSIRKTTSSDDGGSKEITQEQSYFSISIPHAPCVCALACGHVESIRQFREPVALMVFRTHDDFSFPGTSLHVAFSSLIRAGLGQHYYLEQLQTMYNTFSFWRQTNLIFVH